MKHSPYDSWLFESEALSPEDDQALKQHLAQCVECAALAEAWGGVEGRLLDADPVAPEPGFVGRWQMRLEQIKAKRKRRQNWALLASVAGVTFILAPLVGLRLWTAFSAPTEVVLDWFEQLRVFSASLGALKGFITIVVRALGDVHVLWWVGLLVAGLWLGGIWTGLLYRVAFKTIPNGVSR
jgi:anti-sigma factor RsiW